MKNHVFQYFWENFSLELLVETIPKHSFSHYCPIFLENVPVELLANKKYKHILIFAYFLERYTFEFLPKMNNMHSLMFAYIFEECFLYIACNANLN